MTTVRPVPTWWAGVSASLQQNPPRDLLLWCTPHHALNTAVAAIPGTSPRRRVSQLPRRIPPRRYALAIGAGRVERPKPNQVAADLARLRDLLAERVLLWVEESRRRGTVRELRALGFRELARDGSDLLFGFDLYDYKDRPEWLSSAHWANPERWNAERW